MTSAACSHSVYGIKEKTHFCWREIPTALSRSTMQTMGGRFALRHRLRRCWLEESSRKVKNRRGGLDFVCSAVFLNHLQPIKRSGLCLRDRSFGSIALEHVRRGSIFRLPILTATRKLNVCLQTTQICSSLSG